MGVLGDGIDFVAEPTDADLATAVGAIVRADAVVDAVPRPHTADAGARPDRGGHRPGRPRDGDARGIAVVVTPAAAPEPSRRA